MNDVRNEGAHNSPMTDDPMRKPATGTKRSTSINPFNVVGNSDNAETKLTELCYTVLGTAAAFQTIILLKNVVETRFIPQIEDAYGTNDGRNMEDAELDGEATSAEVRESQGLSFEQKQLRTAAHLVEIRDFCADEVKTLSGGNKFAAPTSIKDAIELLCKGDPRRMNPRQQAILDRMVAKGIFTKDELQARQVESAKRNAGQWRDVAAEVYGEFKSLSGGSKDFDLATGERHDDHGASGLSEETLGEHHFRMLPADMGMTLWNKLVAGLPSRFKQFAISVSLELIPEFTIENLESMTVLLSKLQEELRLGRRAYMIAHRNELSSDAGMEATPETIKPVEVQVVPPGPAAVVQKEKSFADVASQLDHMDMMKPNKADLPVLAH